MPEEEDKEENEDKPISFKKVTERCSIFRKEGEENLRTVQGRYGYEIEYREHNVYENHYCSNLYKGLARKAECYPRAEQEAED